MKPRGSFFDDLMLTLTSDHGQQTPCLRTARTYAILTAPAAGWLSNVRRYTSFGKTTNP